MGFGGGGVGPERVPRARAPKCRKSAPRSLKRVRKVSESQVVDCFRTLLRLRGTLFRHFEALPREYPVWGEALFATLPYQKNNEFTVRELFRKVRANFCLLPCDTSQESVGNCSEKLVQMNFFIVGGFFGS